MTSRTTVAPAPAERAQARAVVPPPGPTRAALTPESRETRTRAPIARCVRHA